MKVKPQDKVKRDGRAATVIDVHQEAPWISVLPDDAPPERRWLERWRADEVEPV